MQQKTIIFVATVSFFMSAFVIPLSSQRFKVERFSVASRTPPHSFASAFISYAFHASNKSSHRCRFEFYNGHKKTPRATLVNVLNSDDIRSSANEISPGLPHASAESETFSSAYADRMPQWLLSRLKQLGFLRPTSVQKSVLELALPSSASPTGQDVVIHAQTGSGKTLAYLLPAIASIDPTRSSVQVLIVVPTQELGMQVYRLLRRIVSVYPHVDAEDDELLVADDKAELLADADLEKHHASFPVLPMLNQTDLRRQKLQLRHVAPRVIVGNPHRIAELVDSGRLRLDLLRVLVVDEFDACLLDTSTTNALQTVLSVRGRERQRQTILASATVPQHRHFLRQCVRQHWTRPDIKHLWIEEDSMERVPSSLTHWYALCEGRKKLAALRALILRFNQKQPSEGGKRLTIRAIVFVMPSRRIDEIVDALNQSLDRYYGVQGAKLVVGLSNNLAIVHRRDAMKRFRDGEANVLVATDIAARGLDIPDVSHVFHFDLPTDPDAYLHRAGRTARLGRPGRSVVLISPGEQFVISRTANALGIDFNRVGKESESKK